MRKVILYSLLLVGGLLLSQFLPQAGSIQWSVRVLTMAALSFIMIHAGYEFELDKTRPRQYVWDYIVAGTAAAFPWIFCTLYFVYVMAPPELWEHADLWRETLLLSRFASPTSAGVLFSMLAAAGLASTWVFRKARILAIFDDLDTILLMIPLQIMMVGMRWQLSVVVAIIFALLWLAWRFLHRVRLPVGWPFVLLYAILITAGSETIHLLSKVIDATVPIHLEVLLPAFVLGSVLARPQGANPHRNDAVEGSEEGPEGSREQRVSTVVSACFMVLVGLSMPAMFAGGTEATLSTQVYKALVYDGVPAAVMEEKNVVPSGAMIALHVLIITLLANLGKMFPAFCYRREAALSERIALSVAMFPRGEVGAGVLVISIGYGLGGPALTVAVLSLAVNLLCTGGFIVIVKQLLGFQQASRSASAETVLSARPL